MIVKVDKMSLLFLVTTVVFLYGVMNTYIHFVSEGNGNNLIIPPLPEGGEGYTVLPLFVCPSVQDIFRRIFLSNC